MKCEYCENEIPGSTANFCPFCGVQIELPAQPNAGQVAVVGTSVSNVNDAGCQDTPQEAKIRSYIRDMRQRGWFEEADVMQYGFTPNAGEIVYEVIERTVLYETRSIRRSHTEKTGSSGYNYEGQSESKSHYEFQKVTRGNLFLTNKRILFTGGQQIRNIPFADIVSFVSDWQTHGGSMQISSVKRTKAMRFAHADVFRFTVLYQALRNEKFRQFLESGSEDELVRRFKQVGLFGPHPKPKEVDAAEDEMVTSDDTFAKALDYVILIIIGLVMLASWGGFTWFCSGSGKRLDLFDCFVSIILLILLIVGFVKIKKSVIGSGCGCGVVLICSLAGALYWLFPLIRGWIGW